MKGGFRASHYVILLGFMLAIAVAAGWWLAGGRQDEPRETATTPRTGTAATVKRVVHLYFGDPDGRYLMAEQRVIEQPENPVLYCRMLVEALIDGPRKGGSRVIPADAEVRAVYLLDDDTAVIDFGSNAFARHPGGVNSELLSTYAIVNTLVLNNDAVRAVKLLVGGREADTLAGHVNLEQPFEADMLWVR